LALVRRIDLGVGENYEVGLGSIKRGSGQAAVDEHFVPLLARVVAYLDFFLFGHHSIMPDLRHAAPVYLISVVA
jgi:hypothetical protein